jgi:hypothetical protein
MAQPFDEPATALPERRPPREQSAHGVWVASIALIALVGIVAVAVLTLPDEQKGQNIIAIASASFGVIGAIVGAYFGVSSANRAAELVSEMPTPPERDRHRLDNSSGG